MKRVIYNKRTGEVEPLENFESKKETIFVNGRTKTDNHGWQVATLYSYLDLKALGKPREDRLNLVELPNKQYKELHPCFSYGVFDKPMEDRKKSWFGKICIFSDGTFYDLEKHKILFKEDDREFENFTLLDGGYYCAFSHDWSAFDEIGAIDESYYALKKDGVQIYKSAKPFKEVYDQNGVFVGFETNGNKISLAQVENKLEQTTLKKQLTETLQKLKSSGMSQKDINSMVNQVFGPEDYKQ